MCRFVAYFGHNEILLDELLAKPKNSLIKQSHEAREGLHGVNADGFGLGWYNFNISNYPGVFKSIQPAWNDNNLIHLSQKIASPCFLAHVRASTVGDVNQSNCHPFCYEEYSLVHNGTIRNFENYKRKIIDVIDEDLFLHIKGNTDSEFLFFLIMHFVRQTKSLEQSVNMALKWIVEAQTKCDGFCRINLVITNGTEIMATRFVSKGEQSLSLRYLSKFEANGKLSSLILSSETLNDDDDLWSELPENHYLYLNKDEMELKVEKL